MLVSKKQAEVAGLLTAAAPRYSRSVHAASAVGGAAVAGQRLCIRLLFKLRQAWAGVGRCGQVNMGRMMSGQVGKRA